MGGRFMGGPCHSSFQRACMDTVTKELVPNGGCVFHPSRCHRLVQLIKSMLGVRTGDSHAQQSDQLGTPAGLSAGWRLRSSSSHWNWEPNRGSDGGCLCNIASVTVLAD